MATAETGHTHPDGRVDGLHLPQATSEPPIA